MNKIILLLICTTLLLSSAATGQQVEVWQPVNNSIVSELGERVHMPQKFSLYNLNEAVLKETLWNISEQVESATILSLPMPYGSYMQFRTWQTSVMHPELAAKFPGIKTFTAVSVSDPAITAKISYTHKGFSAMIYNGSGTYYIDPYKNTRTSYYICFYKKDYTPGNIHEYHCSTQDLVPDNSTAMQIGNSEPVFANKTNGTTNRTFRLALSCTGEYAMAVDGSTPSTPNVVSAMTTSLNRVNGILERELGINLQLIANNNLLVYLDPATDPFPTDLNNVIGDNTLAKNQSNVSSVIGSANYDIGHVFCSGNGGIANFQALCDISIKAMGATGNPNPVGDPFDVDYVVHEIGHQLGANHTFNYNGPGCGKHAKAPSAYEPGSGTTIMAYAGLCAGNNIQNHSDDYFHTKSLDQITTYVNSVGLTCGSSTASNNTPPVVADISTVIYDIPYKTAFELEAPQAMDNDHNVLNYCWEQYDLGDFGQGLTGAKFGPIFRSIRPTTSRWRVFPTLDSVRAGVLSYPGEKVPEVARDMHFKLTVRDMLNGMGTFNRSDNDLVINVTDKSGPFELNTPNTKSEYWQAGQTYTVTWKVANTTQAPVNCSNVDIYLSYDDGLTWPTILAANTPNDGSEQITPPLGSFTSNARVKVKGSGNVFFDMSDQGFAIGQWPLNVNNTATNEKIDIYPVPADNELHIESGTAEQYDIRMNNSIGQLVWTGTIQHTATIDVSKLPAGIYHVILTGTANGNIITRKIVIE